MCAARITTLLLHVFTHQSSQFTSTVFPACIVWEFGHMVQWQSPEAQQSQSSGGHYNILDTAKAQH